MELVREKITGRVEEVVIRTQGAWHEVCILGYDGQPRSVWKFPTVEEARAKYADVKRWMEEGRLW